MASDYGRNFGFRRSDESVRVSEGRFKTPAASTLLIGTAVGIDAASAGYLKALPANAPLIPGVNGLLVQEESHWGSIYETEWVDSIGSRLGTAKRNQLSVITNGAGVKVWFKNTAGETRADGRVVSAVTVVDLTGVVVGNQLGWDGSKFVKTSGSVTEAWMTVTDVSVAKGYVEGVLVK